MPDVPNSALAQFDTNDTATNKAANSAAGPSCSGLPPEGGSVTAWSFASGDEGRASRYCSALIARAASDNPQSESANTRASGKLKNATIARMRRYMMAVASVMPAWAYRLITEPLFAWRASTTVVAVDE